MATIRKNISRLFWQLILGLSHLWSKLTGDNQSVKALLNDAFIHDMMKEIEHENLTIDIRNAIVVISTSMYAKYICGGSFSFPDDFKAHRFFSNMRQMLNVMRGYANGIVQQEEKYAFFGNEEMIRFFVKRADGTAYLFGTETPQLLNISIVEKSDEPLLGMKNEE